MMLAPPHTTTTLSWSQLACERAMAAAWRCLVSFSTPERAWFMPAILPAARYPPVTRPDTNPRKLSGTGWNRELGNRNLNGMDRVARLACRLGLASHIGCADHDGERAGRIERDFRVPWRRGLCELREKRRDRPRYRGEPCEECDFRRAKPRPQDRETIFVAASRHRRGGKLALWRRAYQVFWIRNYLSERLSNKRFTSLRK